MRIRKQQPRGNTGEDSTGPNPGPRGQEQELVHSFRRVKEKPGNEGQTVGGGICRVDSGSRSQFTWLDKLRHSKGFTESEPYSNLEEYVNSLSKKDVAILSKGLAESSEEVVQGNDLHRLVGGTSFDARNSARCGSASSGLSFKQTPAGELERTSSLPLFSCDDSSNALAALQGDVVLPNSFCNKWNAAEKPKDDSDIFPGKSSVSSGLPSYDACKEAEYLDLSLGRKDKCKEAGQSPHKRIRDSFEWLAESSDKKDCTGTNSEEPLVNDVKSGTMEDLCAGISLRPAVIKAGLFGQGHVDSNAVCREKACALEEMFFLACLAGEIWTWNLFDLKHTDPVRSDHFLQTYQLQMLWDAAAMDLIGEPAEMISGVLHDDQTQATAESLQRRSSRNRSIPPFTDVNTGQALHAPTIAENSLSFSPDHPAQQPKESLAFSLYTVCKRTGKAGLTAKEIIAVIDIQQNLVCEGPSPNWQREDSLLHTKQTESSTVNDSKTFGNGEGKLPIIAQRWKRNRVAQEREVASSELEIQVKSRPVRSGRPKKLKYLKQENAEELGNQCSRTDGKGWICPLLAKPGYQLCDYHLNKLRCKPGSRSKKKKKSATTPADEAQVSHTLEDPHMVDTAGHEFSTPGDRVTNPMGDLDHYPD
uniref:WRC domain-containing protein n=1 Tax=Physcomitrium patens TaxID=3218 RepID=A0A7I4B159_PHYPA